MRDKTFNVLLIAAYVIFAVLAVFLAVNSARAHDFYPVACCSDKDCWPTGAREPDPKAVRGGWQLYDGTIVPFDHVRASPDGRFHVCRYGGKPDGKLIEAGKPCLWVPEQMS